MILKVDRLIYKLQFVTIRNSAFIEFKFSRSVNDFVVVHWPHYWITIFESTRVLWDHLKENKTNLI